MRQIAIALSILAAACSTSVPPGGGAPSDLGAANDPPTPPGGADLGSSPLDDYIRGQMALSHAPGLSAAIVKGGQIAWKAAYGFRDAAQAIPVTSDTLFQLASVSKTVLSVAVMQLVEQGKLALDDDVDNSLPFMVRNPSFPSTAITYHMLLSHVGSINDNWPVIDGMTVTNMDAPISLIDWFTGYFTPGGAYYSKTGNFTTSAPATMFSYSNQGTALVGLLVERISGTPYDQYCRQHIFQPLGMTETSYRLADLDPSHIAIPQMWNGTSYDELGHHGYPDYPVGTLRTSAPQLARFLLAFMNGGELEGTRILKADTVTQMRTPQYPMIDPTIGIIWFTFMLGPDVVIGHEGGDPGTSTLMYFRPSDNVGVILLSNGDPQTAVLPDIAIHLFDIAKAL
jgi:CubicO group peptidase (beta-lactamase class C family)